MTLSFTKNTCRARGSEMQLATFRAAKFDLASSKNQCGHATPPWGQCDGHTLHGTVTAVSETGGSYPEMCEAHAKGAECLP